MDPQVVSKIQRLLALSKSDNVHEAANAAASAQRLLDEHRLTRAALPETRGDTMNAIGRTWFMGAVTGRTAPWKIRLAANVAEHNGAIILFYKGLVEIVGTPDDVSATRLLYDYLRGEIDRLTAQETKGRGVRYANNFRLGAVETIGLRLIAARRRATTGAATTALVLSSADKARDYVRATTGKQLNTRTVGEVRDAEAAEHGKRAARAIPLKQGLPAQT